MPDSVQLDQQILLARAKAVRLVASTAVRLDVRPLWRRVLELPDDLGFSQAPWMRHVPVCPWKRTGGRRQTQSDAPWVAVNQHQLGGCAYPGSRQRSRNSDVGGYTSTMIDIADSRCLAGKR